MVPEHRLVQGTEWPRTRASLLGDLRELGLGPGDLVIAHVSLSALGWVAGGAQTVILALLDTVGPNGTLVMPTHTGDNSDPADWRNPPVPEDWWPIIRSELPAYDPRITPTRGMGRVAELFRTWPGTERSAHPKFSFAAHGPLSAEIVRSHRLDDPLGEESPLGSLYRLGARVLLLGCGHESNTSLHLAEYRVEGLPRERSGAAVMQDGVRIWATFSDVRHLDSDALFPEIGHACEARHARRIGHVGSAEARLLAMREMVDFAVPWIARRFGAP